MARDLRTFELNRSLSWSTLAKFVCVCVFVCVKEFDLHYMPSSHSLKLISGL